MMNTRFLFCQHERGCESTEQVYRMEKKPHGQAVIFNFIEEHPAASRVTVDKFMDTFKDLHYRVHEYPFLSKEVMKRKLTEDVRSGDDSFVCCIIAHGDQGIIVVKDGKVAIQDLQTEVVMECPDLFGKPKIFIQECRGTDVSIPLDASKKDKVKSVQLSREADFYFAYSTTEGHIALLDPNDGCVYVNTLCKVFKERADHFPLDEMVMEVHHKLESKVSKVNDKKCNKTVQHIEMGQVVHTLRGPVYFKKN